MRAIIIFILIISAITPLISLSFNAATLRFQSNLISFDLKPYIEVYSSQTQFEAEPIELRDWDVEDNRVVLDYASDRIEITVDVNLHAFLQPTWHDASINITYLEEMNIRNIVLKMNLQPGFNCLQGPKAIFNGNRQQNRNLYPFIQRSVQYNYDDQVLGIIASNLGENPGAEIVEGDNLYLYSCNYHWAPMTTYHGHHMNWMPVHAVDSFDYLLAITESEPLLAYVNPYPATKKGALAITNDADSECEDFIRAMYWGSSDPTDEIYGTKGLIPNEITVCNTVFGCNYESVGDYWTEIMESGSTIGFHTYDPLEDDMDLLEDALLNNLTQYNIRMWIDHSSMLNPEDICREGYNPESEHYIMDILSEAGFDYAWIGFTDLEYHYNSFDDPRQLPHRIYALPTARPIWYYERLRCEFWLYSVWPEYDFFHNVSYANITEILKNNGFIQPYTHFYIQDNSLRYGFLRRDAANDRYVIRDEAEYCLRMLNDFQQNEGLWITPTEVLFDRLRAVDSVYVTNIQQTDYTLHYTYYNGSSTVIKDFEVQFKNEYETVNRFYPGTSVTLEFEHNTGSFTPETSPTKHIYTFIKGTRLYVRSQTRDSNLKSVGIYNIKGQRIVEDSNLKTSEWNYDMHRQANGVYFIKTIDHDNQQKIMRAVYVR